MKTLKEMKAGLQAARTTRDQEQGRLNAAKEVLAERFGVSTKKQADEKLEELNAAVESAQEAYDTLVEQFATDYPEIAT